MRGLLYRLGYGLTGRKLIAQLQREHSHGGPSAGGPAPPGPGTSGASDGSGGTTLLKNAEVSVLISINDTLASRDRRHGRSLTRLQKALVTAAHASLDAAALLKTTRAHPRWANGGPAEVSEPQAVPGQADTRDDARPAGRWRSWTRPGTDPQPGANAPAFREMFDPHQPLIVERTLLIIEAVFVVVEFAFWYGVFSENVGANAPALDPTRISDILLAVMVPLSGIVAARVVGGLTHRVMRRYPGIGRSEYIGAVISAVVAALAIIAIFTLIHARFDASSQPIGAVQLPALAMTLVFVVVLAGDMIARIFLVSEIRAQTDKWFRHLGKLAARASRANRRHAEAWLNLRNAAQMQLDTYERVVAAGARIISDQRSRTGAPAPVLPAASPEIAIRPAHATGNDGTAPGPMAVPSAAQLQLYGVSLALGPLRVVEDAVDTLRKWPPRDQQALGKHLDDMLEQLYRLKSAAPAGASAAARTPAEAPGPHFQPSESAQAGPPEGYPGGWNGADPATGHGPAGRGDGS